MRPPELDHQVPLATIAAFAHDGLVCRAYGYAIAADRGMVLLVPIGRVDGDLERIVDRCPVPWEEVIGILEEPPATPRPLPLWCQTVCGRQLLQLAPSHWDVDEIRIGPGRGAVATRLTHPCGMVLAVLRALLPNNGDLWGAN